MALVGSGVAVGGLVLGSGGRFSGLVWCCEVLWGLLGVFWGLGGCLGGSGCLGGCVGRFWSLVWCRVSCSLGQGAGWQVCRFSGGAVSGLVVLWVFWSGSGLVFWWLWVFWWSSGTH